MKERSLKDSSGTIYIVKDFVKKRHDARKAIHVKCIDSSGTETKANIYAVIKLIVIITKILIHHLTSNTIIKKTAIPQHSGQNTITIH